MIQGCPLKTASKLHPKTYLYLLQDFLCLCCHTAWRVGVMANLFQLLLMLRVNNKKKGCLLSASAGFTMLQKSYYCYAYFATEESQAESRRLPCKCRDSRRRATTRDRWMMDTTVYHLANVGQKPYINTSSHKVVVKCYL